MNEIRILYPREMMESAKREGKELITLSACGMTIQNKVDRETAERVLEFMFGLLNKTLGETN